MNPSTKAHAFARWTVAAGLAALIVVAIAGLIYTFKPAQIHAPGELDPLLRAMRQPVPFYCNLVNRQVGKSLRAGKRPWIPQQLVRYAGNKADRVYQARMQARWKLKSMGTNAWPATPALLAALDDANIQVRWAAADVLAGIEADKHPSFERLKTALAGKTRPAHAFAWVLVHNDEFQRSYSPSARRFALVGLTACGRGAKAAVPTLHGMIKSKEEDHDMRSLAVTALSTIDRGAPSQTTPMLRQIMQDPEEWPDVRGAAALALACVAPNDSETPILLHQALEDKAALVRIKAAAGLSRLKTPPEELLPVLVDALNHKLASIRCASLSVLAAMRNAARPARAAMEARLADEKEEVRRQAAIALQNMSQE